MFYGLSRFIKNLLPKRLFYRALLIVAAPIIILQITISIVFFDSLWIKTNKGMTRSLVSEIYTFVEAYKNEADYNKQKLTDLYYQNFQLNIKYYSITIINVDCWNLDSFATLHYYGNSRYICFSFRGGHKGQNSEMGTSCRDANCMVHSYTDVNWIAMV